MNLLPQLDPSSSAASANLALKPRYASWQILPAALLLGLLLALALWFGSRGTESATAAESFPGQGFLPDNRAWEMVSPPDKNGGQPIPSSGFTRSTPDCSSECAVSFASLAGFADVGGFSGPLTQYVARRTAQPDTQGWATHSVTPPQDPPSALETLGLERFGYWGEFSPDLSTGVFQSLSPVPTADDPHPNVEEYQSIYRRTDLTTPGAGTYELLTDAPAPLSTEATPNFAGSNSGDESTPALSTVALEARVRLADAPPAGSSRRLYVEAHGSTRVVNQVPAPADARCGGSGPPCTTVTSSGISSGNAGTAFINGDHQLAHLDTQNVISNDGRRVFFRSPVNAANGNATAASRLYMRNDQGTEDQSDDTFTRIQQSERTTPASPVSATFWAATEDGEQAFFSTTEGLVDDDNNGSEDLYMYTDSADPANDSNLTRISIDNEGTDDPDVTDVVAVTPDADYVYFVAKGELVPGQDSIHECFLCPGAIDGWGLYLWHEGNVFYVGEFRSDGSRSARGDVFYGYSDHLFNSLNTPTRGGGSAGQYRSQRRYSEVTQDGTLLFMATNSDGFVGVGGFSGYDHGTCDFTKNPSANDACREYFVYDPNAHSLECATCKPSGAPATSDAFNLSEDLDGIALTNEESIASSISGDGRWIFFMTSERLVPEDTNGPCDPGDLETRDGVGTCTDVYVYDTESDRVRLISSGKSDSPSYFIEATPDGSDVFFATREKLSAWDTDNSYDIYDARIDGGFPEPAPDADCEDAEECRGPGSSGPGGENTGSGGFEGEGNVEATQAPDCNSNERKLAKAKKKLRKARKRIREADGKKAKQKAKRAKKRAKKKVKQSKRRLARCEGGNS